MDKFFKRTLVGAAVAAVAAAGSVNAASLTDNVDLYGQAAVSVWYMADVAEGKDHGLDIENESRIGLRGTQEFKNFGPAIIWQMETGNVGDDGSTGTLGGRDSFIGFQFDAGKFRFGRLTQPAYDIVDWPYTNPGLGNVFDWNTDIAAGAHVDRSGDTFRWDSKNYNGFTYAASAFKGDKDVDNMGYSVAAHYSTNGFTLHAGYQTEGDAAVSVKNTATTPVESTSEGQRSFYILGAEYSFGNGFHVTAAIKEMETDYTVAGATNALTGVSKQDQRAYSVTAQYDTAEWQYKLGYAATSDLSTTGGNVNDKNTGDTAITARVLFKLDPSAVIYADIRSYDMGVNAYDVTADRDDQAGDVTKFGIGVEYYF
ncbi:porin [Vibrio scophthalmi]|uniref:Chitoporin n=1 Tax=Vibrio scophthalmi TaxID=45658 RepID=A0A1C7FBR1_9VIBR|nr:porin [Vibrio scophthalmi]ANU37168.1 Chitoporin [Vibrio scophthalmi]